MKKVGYLLFASALVALGGCSDDTFEQTGGTPAKVGDEITFGSSLNDVAVRTVYSDSPVNGAYIVSWEKDGSDTIAIYCPEASNGTLVDYSVMPDATDSTRSSTVTKVNPNEAGLQWGNAKTHHFYGFYPASRVLGTEQGKIKGNVPTTQNVRSWNVVRNNAGGKNYYGKTNTDNAYMWAYGAFDREEMGKQDVPLTFHPWMTVLEIKIPGPKDGSTRTVTNVNVSAIEGTQTALAGDFICDMSPVVEAGQAGTIDAKVAPNYEPVTQGEVNNTISISGYMPDEDHFVTLTQSDTMIVRAYLLPIDEQNATNARNIQISVATLNGGALHRTLGYSAHGENSVQPHKVNTVILPPLADGGTNYWMSSLDKDVYISEISMPGSKFSYLSAANGAGAPYQGVDLDQQFIDGVRAFMVQVGVEATYRGTRNGLGNYSYEYQDATLNVQGALSGTTLAQTIENLAQQLETAENELSDRNLECAVLMVTATGEPGNEDVNFTGQQPIWGANVSDVGGGWKVWIEAVTNELQKLIQDGQDRIYTGEITANTTLNDVKGKIILKINYNEASQEDDVAADATYPMLFSRWDGIINTVPLRWGSPNTNSSRSPLTWYYQEATHIGSGTQGTAAEKWENIQTVFQNSVEMYESNTAHDTWFMNDCGGKFYGTVTGVGSPYDGSYSTTEEGDSRAITNFTNWISPQVTRYLQTRVANASLGLVYFNFADKQPGSGAQYGVDYMVQTVIDNNFKFNLRKKGGSSTTNTIGGGGSSMGDGGNAIQ